MSTIHNPDNSFLFDKIALAKPVLTTGGNYFIRCSIDNEPLYIQPPKCKSKQGILTASKKIYTDLMFSNMNNDFIKWIETLETTFQEYIFKNKNEWFDGDMELHDIENYFTSTLKTYRSGKYYLIRGIIPSSLGKPMIKIYDDNELSVNIDDIDNNTVLMNILEIKGIKCSTKSFHIDIEIKQMLALNPSNIFDNFLLKQPNQNKESSESAEESKTVLSIHETYESQEAPEQQDAPEPQEIISDTLNVNITTEETQIESNDKTPVILTDEMIQENIEEVAQESSQEILENNFSNAYQSENNIINTENNTHNNFTNEVKESLEKNNNLEVPEINLVNNSLQELDINLDDLPTTNSFQIKERNNIYYDMYREARRKAKTARDLALSSLLEAKRIKNTYLLNDISDSEDSEESDLENE